jgi:D-alanyl-D-alanine carboxypeptidase
MVEYAGADGLKTGYIHASGYNLVTSAVHNGRRLIGVVLGGRTGGERDRTMMRLLDRGFATRATIREASATPPAQPAPVQVSAVVAAAAPAVAAAPAAAAVPAPAAMAAVPAAAAVPTAASVPAADPAQQFLPAGPLVAVTQAPLDEASGQGDRTEAPIAHPRTAPALAMVEGDDANEGHAVRTNRWGIQVGAYTRHAQAEAAALRLKRATVGLRRATISIAESRAGRNTVYRARLLGLSAGEARAACSKIHHKRGECVILNPGTERSLAALRQ